MEKADKNCCVRFPPSLHKAMKFQACKEGKTIQDWTCETLIEKLSSGSADPAWLCNACGKWELKGTQYAKLGKCEWCSKEEVPTFPCKIF